MTPSPALTPDERRPMTDDESGQTYLRGKRDCAETHGDIQVDWYAFGLNAGLRSGRRQGFTSGVTRGLMVALGLAVVAGALARRWGR